MNNAGGGAIPASSYCSHGTTSGGAEKNKCMYEHTANGCADAAFGGYTLYHLLNPVTQLQERFTSRRSVKCKALGSEEFTFGRFGEGF